MPRVSTEGIRQANIESKMAKNRQLRRLLETNRQQQATTNNAELLREKEKLKPEVASLKKALPEASGNLAEAPDKLAEASERVKQSEHERKRASDLVHDLREKFCTDWMSISRVVAV